MRSDPNLGFVGFRGEGKTYTARLLSQSKARVVFVDPIGREEAGPKGFTLSDPRRVCQVILHYHAFEAVWRCSHLSKDDRRDGVDLILGAMAQSGKLDTLILDEYALLRRKGAPLSGPLERAVRGGRHDQIAVWLCTQRANDMPPDIRAQLDVIKIWRQPETADREALKRLHPDLPAAVQRLKRRHYVNFKTSDPDGWTVHPPIQAK